jgi:hypothetical protein
MSDWTKDKKLDALMDIITEDHWPTFYEDEGTGPDSVYRCACGDAGIWRDHLRQMIDNEGFICDDPGVGT